MVKKFKSTFALTAILMVTVLLSGCIGGGTKTFTLTVNVDPEGAAAVSGVADKYDEKALAQFTLEAAEGYEFVEWTGEDKPVYNDEDEVWEIVMDGDKTLTAVFKEIEEEPVDLEELIAAAEAAIAALPKDDIKIEDAAAVEAARALVDAVLELDEEAEIEGLAILEAAELGLTRLRGNSISAEQIKAALQEKNEVDFKEKFKGEELALINELEMGTSTFTLSWSSSNIDVIEIDKYKSVAKVTRPEEDTKVTLTATLGYEIAPQAIAPQTFDVEVTVWGWVSELKANAKPYQAKPFEKALKVLVPDYDEALLSDYADAIADRLKLETKEDVQKVIDGVNKDKVGGFNEAVAGFFAATTKSEREEALVNVTDGANTLGLKDWIDDLVEKNYLPALRDGDTSDLPKIQAIVNEVNLNVLAALVETAEADPRKVDDYNKAKNLFDAITEVEASVKDPFDVRLQAVKWVSNVLGANENGVIEKLQVTIKDLVKLENVNDVLSEEYVAAFAKLEGAVTIADIEAAVDEVNETELQKAIDNVLKAKAKKKDDKDVLVTDALTRLAAIVGKDWKAKIRTELAQDYVKAIAAGAPVTAEDIHDIVIAVEFVADINAADVTKLHDIIIELDVIEFINLSADQRDEVAGFLVVDVDEEGYTSTEQFRAAVVEEVATYLTIIAGVNNAKTNYTMWEALTALVETYGDPEVQKVTILVVDRMVPKVNDENFEPYTTIGKIVADAFK